MVNPLNKEELLKAVNESNEIDSEFARANWDSFRAASNLVGDRVYLVDLIGIIQSFDKQVAPPAYFINRLIEFPPPILWISYSKLDAYINRYRDQLKWFLPQDKEDFQKKYPYLTRQINKLEPQNFNNAENFHNEKQFLEEVLEKPYDSNVKVRNARLLEVGVQLYMKNQNRKHHEILEEIFLHEQDKSRVSMATLKHKVPLKRIRSIAKKNATELSESEKVS